MNYFRIAGRLLVAGLIVLATASAAFATGAAEEDGPVELRLNNAQNTRVEAYARIAEEYESLNPSVSIVTERLGGENYYTALRSALAAGDLPTINMVTPWGVIEDYATGGHARAVTDSDILDRFFPQYLEGVTFDGETYAFPVEISAMGITYNATLFEELGIDPPSTFGELQEAVDTVTEAGIVPFAAAFRDVWTLRDLFALGHTASIGDVKGFVDRKSSGENVSFGTGMDQAFEFFDLVRNNTFDDPFAYAYSDASAAFAQGEAAMFVQGQWVLSAVRGIDPDFDLGMFGVPIDANPANTKIAVDVANAFFVSSSATEREQEAALSFLDWFYDVDRQQEWVEANEALSTLRGVEAPESLGRMGDEITQYSQLNRTMVRGEKIWPSGFDMAVVGPAMQAYMRDGDREALISTLDSGFADYVGE